MPAAAREEIVSLSCRRNIEQGRVTPSEESALKVEQLLWRNRKPYG
jgi:hypothetical protein